MYRSAAALGLAVHEKPSPGRHRAHLPQEREDHGNVVGYPVAPDLRALAYFRALAAWYGTGSDTVFMPTATDAKTEPLDLGSGALDTGPQAVLELAEQGLAQRTIAERLQISQATVTRRIRAAIDARQAQRRAYAMALMCTVLTLCAVVITIAVSCLAWAGPA